MPWLSIIVRCSGGHSASVAQQSRPAGRMPDVASETSASAHAQAYDENDASPSIPDASAIAWHSALVSCAATQSVSLMSSERPSASQTLLHACPHALGS